MKRLANMISVLLAALSVAFLGAIVAVIVSAEIRADPGSYAHLPIHLGCFLNRFAAHILVVAFVLLGLEVTLNARAADADLGAAPATSRWKQALMPQSAPTPRVCLVATLSRGALVLFFISQLSYHLNHCQQL